MGHEGGPSVLVDEPGRLTEPATPSASNPLDIFAVKKYNCFVARVIGG